MNGQHHDLVGRWSKVNRVGELRQHRSASFAVNTLKEKWFVGDSGDDGFDRLAELATQTHTT